MRIEDESEVKDMIIKIVKEEDLLKAAEDVIGHQVNCQGVVGSGVAKMIREQFPVTYEQYKMTCDSTQKHRLLGECQIVSSGKGKYIASVAV